MRDPIFYKLVRGPLTGVFKLVYRPTVIGKEKIPKKGKVILAGNHTNYFDCFLVSGSTRRCVHYLAKKELMKGPLKIVFKGLGIIPVNRKAKDKAALETAEAFLNDEKLIGIFPEGTINRTNDIIMPFKFGAVKMANATNTPIIPFVISGKYKPFKKSVKIQFFDPIIIGDNLEEENNLLMKTVSNVLIKEGVKNEKT